MAVVMKTKVMEIDSGYYYGFLVLVNLYVNTVTASFKIFRCVTQK